MPEAVPVVVPIGPRGLLAAAGILVVTVGVLRAMGRVWWCTCGSYDPISWDVWSRHNSQHIADPYFFSHVQHGLVFAALLYVVLRVRWPDVQFAAAVALESAWEILENTPLVIDRYREATVSLDYTGDAIANSIADVAACALGFAFARRVPWWVTLVVFAVFELGMLVTIRDSLLLNVIMLVAPIDAIRAWQTGA